MKHNALIADSGSTKTRWVLADGCDVVASTAGLNPRLTSEGDFHSAMQQMLTVLPAAAEAEEVWFYGAGCGTEEMQRRVALWIGRALPKATVEVEGDLLGACRAVCGETSGLVGIVGTGSNLCHYDGRGIDCRWTSTGYLLGDEGSGNHIGRRLLKDYLEGTMPDDVATMFRIEHPMSHEELLQCLYERPYPNRFLASFVPFAARFRDNPYVAWVLQHCFDAFMAQVKRHHLPVGEPLHLAGGLTATFPEELGSAARRAGLAVGTFTPDPLEGLVRFHSTKKS